MNNAQKKNPANKQRDAALARDAERRLEGRPPASCRDCKKDFVPEEKVRCTECDSAMGYLAYCASCSEERGSLDDHVCRTCVEEGVIRYDKKKRAWVGSSDFDPEVSE